MDEKSAEPACIYEGGPKAAGTLVIKLGYRGEGFCGFAEQPRSAPSLASCAAPSRPRFGVPASLRAPAARMLACMPSPST